jgi:hypothetical protein
VELRSSIAKPRFPHPAARHSELEICTIRHSKFSIRQFPSRRLKKRLTFRQTREKGRDTGDAHPSGSVKPKARLPGWFDLGAE